MGNELDNERNAINNGSQKLVYDKTTGQFRVLEQRQRVDADTQTEMRPSNIPNAG